MRQKFIATELETGWYFQESLRSSDVLRDHIGYADLPDVHDYLQQVKDGLAAAAQQANGNPSVKTAPLDIVDKPVQWLPLRAS